MSSKPIIGISGSIIVDGSGNFPGYKRAYVNNDYVESVIRAGGVPYILPITEDPEIIKEYTKTIDGLILSGGHDVNPLLWGEEPKKELGEIFPKRDNFEFLLIENMLEEEKPIFGICRGEQILNVYFGGTLYQDLSHKKDCDVRHNQKTTPSLETHTVIIEKSSQLYKVLEEENILVNSFHHMAIKDVAPGFEIVALSKDCVVEAVEMKDRNIMAVQWHPEMLSKTNKIMQKLFNYFVSISSEE
ncbi:MULTISPECIES: gamma-glutamyl-gamma-aminobutyrate hydrolase family protein [Cetobacterium]|jgi:putative glutamine amidotransferase|uniref:Gamma-glutamyl-gamma-aminobutyrate hydrolase family protein n=1 Tax=Candidatus Cetobacterium colombiensis TaxID=3073100 RepID=A0ABU4WCL4_9FUSO|nr:gamma-glutamyl-gamma-aminobutyrate hydrolase family protein [Candidatus Cetobacterium colombiensis]MDX8337257.1 gamma-glutamyl-gamma-aminobutyrate hydrolase family protein [Candidatus Cetobacterium colombiensis]